MKKSRGITFAAYLMTAALTLTALPVNTFAEDFAETVLAEEGVGLITETGSVEENTDIIVEDIAETDAAETDIVEAAPEEETIPEEAEAAAEPMAAEEIQEIPEPAVSEDAIFGETAGAEGLFLSEELYPAKAEANTTETVTVTFDANGKYFTSDAMSGNYFKLTEDDDSGWWARVFGSLKKNCVIEKKSGNAVTVKIDLEKGKTYNIRVFWLFWPQCGNYYAATWKRASDGAVIRGGEDITLKKDETYIAQWSKKCTISYDVNEAGGGVSSFDETIIEQDTYVGASYKVFGIPDILPLYYAEKDKNGNTNFLHVCEYSEDGTGKRVDLEGSKYFLGWKIKGSTDGKLYQTLEDYTPTGDTVFIAQWKGHDEIDISKATVTGIADATYTGKAIAPVPTVKVGSTTLKNGTDYTVAYKNNTNVGTATVTITGKGIYTGTVTKTFKISAVTIAKATVTGIADATYTGKAIAPVPTVKVGSTTLKNGTDYTVAYKNNTNVGTATVTITGKGSYIGTVTKTFKITPQSIAKAAVTGIKDKTYTGKALNQVPAVKLGSTALKSGTDFKIAYKNNKAVGTATVTITGKGNYTGTITKTFKINPKGTTVSKLTGGKKKITVKWKKQATQTAGYQIQYSTDKNFKSGNKTVTVKNAKTVSKAISKLKAKKTYYVRIRTYKKVGKTTYYSAWSKAKSVKTK